MTPLPKVPQLNSLPSAAYKTITNRVDALEDRFIEKITACVDSLIILATNITLLSNTLTTKLDTLDVAVETLQQEVRGLREEKSTINLDNLVIHVDDVASTVRLLENSLTASSIQNQETTKRALDGLSERVGGIEQGVNMLLLAKE